MALEFDKMSVDISLALKFLEEEQQLSNFLNNFEDNVPKNYLFNGKEFATFVCVTNINLNRKFDHLGVLIGENIKLFSQLEYYFRKIPLESTEAQLNLVRYHALSIKKSDEFADLILLMDNETPILNLGCAFNTNPKAGTQIVAVQSTVAVSYLFTKLCRQAGFDGIFVNFNDKVTPKTIESCDRNLKDINTGTLAVVSEDADLDSAIDVLVASPVKTPWELRRIFVQESVYEQFKDTLRWKWQLNNKKKESTSTFVCAETMTFSDKTFVIDLLDSADLKSVVTIEAYRTNKELLTLVNKHEMLYLSLWANGIEGINEIAYNVKSSIVWVNNFGDIQNSQRLGEAIYSYIFKDYGLSAEKGVVIKHLLETWVKYDVEERRKLLRSFCNSCKDDEEIYQVICEKLNNIKVSDDSFVFSGSGFICTGLDKTPFKYSVSALHSFENLEALVNGKGVILLDRELSSSERGLIEKYNLPVESCGKGQVAQSDFYKAPFDYVKKVILSYYGTIFAN